MDEIMADFKKALGNAKAVDRYAAGYRAERKPSSKLDLAVQNYKEAQEKRQRLARYGI